MWRDRTNLYISYRQSYAHHPTKRPRYIGPSANGFSNGASDTEERRGLMSAGAFEDDGDAVIEMDLLPPRWIDVQDEVSDRLAEIVKKSAKLEQLHQKHVLPGFDDEDVRREEEAVIERMTQEITRGFHGCQRAIQRIETMARDAKQQGGVRKGDETMARNIQISLASRVQEVSAAFRKKQSNYLKKLRTLGGMSSPLDRASTPSQNPYTDPSMMESETDKSYSQSTLQQTSQKRLGSNDTAIMQREREITDIAKGIIELSNIFSELQTMVIDQGTMLDRIDYNVERMAVDVKAADKELTVATGYQRKTTKRKILLLLLLLVIGMFILLLVKPKRHAAAPTPPPPDQAPNTKPQAIPNNINHQDWEPPDTLPNTFEIPPSPTNSKISRHSPHAFTGHVQTHLIFESNRHVHTRKHPFHPHTHINTRRPPQLWHPPRTTASTSTRASPAPSSTASLASRAPTASAPPAPTAKLWSSSSAASPPASRSRGGPPGRSRTWRGACMPTCASCSGAHGACWNGRRSWLGRMLVVRTGGAPGDRRMGR